MDKYLIRIRNRQYYLKLKPLVEKIPYKSFTLLMFIPLTLSAFTHIWNPTGFPDIFYDEGIYLRRAMHEMAGQGPQESLYFFDHPYFGHIFSIHI